MTCVLSGEMLPCTYEIAGGSLRGIGHSLLPALITVVGSCVLRIVWVYTIFKMYSQNFYVLMIIYPITWVATGAAMLISYYVISRKEFKVKIGQPPDKPDDDVIAERDAEQEERVVLDEA